MENYTIKVLGLTWGVDEWPTRVRCQHESSDNDMRWYVPERTCKMTESFDIGVEYDPFDGWYCSECKTLVSEDADKPKFCPNCGAKCIDGDA